MKKPSTYLVHWDRCEMTKKQGAALVAHLDKPQSQPVSGFDRSTINSLIERRWLRRDPATLVTALTARGRLAACRAAAAFADKTPSIVPELDAAAEKETA